MWMSGWRLLAADTATANLNRGTACDIVADDSRTE